MHPRRGGEAVTTFAGPRTTVEIDSEHGVVRVYDAKTGRLMYALRIAVK